MEVASSSRNFGRELATVQAVFAQPELPLKDVEALDAIRRVELWLSTQPNDAQDVDVVSARVYLRDSDTRLQRARRWVRVLEINERCTNEWGVLMHGGSETAWLLNEAAHGLAEGHWLASLLCSHAACERHLAGILTFDGESLPRSWRTWGLGSLLEVARQRDIVPLDLWEPLEALNERRKVSAHFKPPLHDKSLIRRAQATGTPRHSRIGGRTCGEDAFAAYEAARSLVHRARLSWA